MGRLLFGLVIAACSVAAADAWARGGGGGGGRVGGGGGGGAAAHTPSMSRAVKPPAAASKPMAKPNLPAASKPNLPSTAAGRPNISKPELGGNRPGINRPDNGGNRPNLADRKPEGINRPDFGGAKPGDRPQLSGNDRPQFPGNGRPQIPGNGRPSQGDLSDFLDMPGQSTGNHPNLADRRPNIGDNKLRPDGGALTNVGDRANIGGRNNIGDRTRVGDVNINAGNSVNINRQNNVNSMQNRWTNVNQRPFGNNWWGSGVAGGPAWRWQAGWNRYPGYWGWRPCAWATFGTWFAWSWARPIAYDYGSNVVYQNNAVYVDGAQYATADAYYDQATTIAAGIPRNVDPNKLDWLPLGVFAVTQDPATDMGMLVQLAVSKEGIIAGTFYNETTNVSRPIEGAVDQKSQRAAWRFADGNNPDIVMETGIVNLTKDESSSLVHFGKDKTETWLMVRLPEPEGDQAAK